MNLNESKNDLIVIRTLECDICSRFDSIMLSHNEIQERVKQNSLNIGSHVIYHIDHVRIIYFDKFGTYLGDTISLNNQLIDPSNQNSSISNLPTFSQPQVNFISKFQRKMLQKILKVNYNICIVGPTYAGKTSLVIYLENGIPERYNKRMMHSPTMGRSLKRIKLGSTHLTIFDMGGQKDFWEGWIAPIRKSDKIIFVIDVTTNNTKEIVEGLEIVLTERKPNTDILILFNKMDLYFEGYVKNIIRSNNFYDELNKFDINKIWIIETSIFNGIVYNSNDIIEEIPLSKIILDFIEGS